MIVLSVLVGFEMTTLLESSTRSCERGAGGEKNKKSERGGWTTTGYVNGFRLSFGGEVGSMSFSRSVRERKKRKDGESVLFAPLFSGFFLAERTER